MIKKILVVLVAVIVLVLAGWINYGSNSVYEGVFSDTDPTGKYKISLVAISEDPQDNALEITDVKKNELVMSIPPEMLVNRIESVDKFLDRNTTIYIASTGFQDGNIGPWSKGGVFLWGKLEKQDGSLYRYYRINLQNRKLEIVESLDLE